MKILSIPQNIIMVLNNVARIVFDTIDSNMKYAPRIHTLVHAKVQIEPFLFRRVKVNTLLLTLFINSKIRPKLEDWFFKLNST